MSTAYSNNPKTRQRQRAIERQVLAFIKRGIRDGWAPCVPLRKRYTNLFLMSMPWHNALDRLKEKGLVEYRKDRVMMLGGYAPTEKGWKSR